MKPPRRQGRSRAGTPRDTRATAGMSSGASRRLRVMERPQEGLGLETIMDRSLAEQHGSAYVRLAVFAIDVDRVRALHAGPDASAAALPFGWEVFLTEHYLLSRFDLDDAAQRSLVEDACLSVLDAPPDQSRFGDQLPFALYDALARGAAPEALRSVFHHWQGAPKGLLKDLARLWEDAEQQAGALARVCLAAPLNPPAAPPTREAWLGFAN